MSNYALPISRRFAIALSYAAENRALVRSVAERLADKLGREKVFFDEWHGPEFQGVDSDVELRKIYRDASELVVPFFSEHYRKPWCGLEWSAIRGVLLERRHDHAVLPVHLDNTQIEGWEVTDLGFRGTGRQGPEIAEGILDYYGRHRGPRAVADAPSLPRFPRPVAATALPFNTFRELVDQAAMATTRELTARVGGKYLRHIYVPRALEERWLVDQVKSQEQWLRTLVNIRTTIERETAVAGRGHAERLRSFECSTENSAKALIEKASDIEKEQGITKKIEDTRNAGGEVFKSPLAVPAGYLVPSVTWIPRQAPNTPYRRVSDYVVQQAAQIEEYTLQLTTALKAEIVQRAKARDFVFSAGKNVIADIKQFVRGARTSVESLDTLKASTDSIRDGLSRLISDRLPLNASTRQELSALARAIVELTKSLTGPGAEEVTQFGAVLRRLASPASLIIAKAGSGKTNLLCSFVESLNTSNRAALFVAGGVSVEAPSWLVTEVLGHLGVPVDVDPREALKVLDRLLGSEGETLYVVVDGINETANIAGMDAALQYAIELFSSHRVRVIVSCRDIYWSFFKEPWIQVRDQDYLHTDFYRFSEPECLAALDRYRLHFRLWVDFSQVAMAQVRHPLLMRFFFEAYGDPARAEHATLGWIREIRLKPLFDQYWEKKLRDSESERVVYRIADAMLSRANPVLPQSDISEVCEIDDLESPASPYVRIRDEHVIIRQEERSAQRAEGEVQVIGASVRFVYEPFMEYAMARSIFMGIARGRELGDAEVEELVGVVFDELHRKSEDFANVVALGEFLIAFLIDPFDGHEPDYRAAAVFVEKVVDASGIWKDKQVLANVLEREAKAIEFLFGPPFYRRMKMRCSIVREVVESAFEGGGSPLLIEVASAIAWQFLLPPVIPYRVVARLSTLDPASIGEDLELREAIRRQKIHPVKPAVSASTESSEYRSAREAMSEVTRSLAMELRGVLDYPAKAAVWTRLRWREGDGSIAPRLLNRDLLIGEMVAALIRHGPMHKVPLLAYVVNGLFDAEGQVAATVAARARDGHLGAMGTATLKMFQPRPQVVKE